MSLLTDCTNAIGVPLVYDRGKKTGLGVPVPTHKDYRGAQKLYDALEGIGRDLKQMEWLQYIDSVLTAGLYVKKPGDHGKGNAWDFDGVVLKPRQFIEQILILVYKADQVSYQEEGNYMVLSLSDRICTRLACLFSLRFGVVLTAGYNKAHEDHMHMSIAGEVGWRGSRSQVVLVQETLNAWFDAGLVVDGVFGTKTWRPFRNALNDKPKVGHEGEYWLAWLKMIAFGPPIKDKS